MFARLARFLLVNEVKEGSEFRVQSSGFRVQGSESQAEIGASVRFGNAGTVATGREDTMRDAYHIPSGCAIVGIMSEDGRLFDGTMIMDSITNMHFRANGLGGGFSAYGIYPEQKDHYALHMMFDAPAGKDRAEEILARYFVARFDERIPTRRVAVIKNRPMLWRYFVTVKEEVKEEYYDFTEEDIVVKAVMEINRTIGDAFVTSSGKNMGVFKGVGYPEDIGEFFKLESYKAYQWTAHGRFPTNTSGWWGGAHPFGLLDWSIVHNGEISSYGINRRYLSNFGYECYMQTDTEVITYLFDLLVRKHRLPIDIAAKVLAAPLWTDIETKPDGERQMLESLRMIYGGALLNGPFSVVLGSTTMMVGLNDRIKLRPMVAARDKDLVFIASEEAAIRTVCRNPEHVWSIKAGEPVVAVLKEKAA